MDFIRKIKLPTLLFWLALSSFVIQVATVVFEMVAGFSPTAWYWPIVGCGLVSAVLFFLCTLRPFDWHTRRMLYSLGAIVSFVYSLLSSISWIASMMMNGFFAPSYIISILMEMLPAAFLLVIAISLLKGRLQTLLFLVYCVFTAVDLGNEFYSLTTLFDGWFAYAVDSLLQFLAALIKFLFIALSLNVARHPAEVSLRELQCNHTAGKLDEETYQEQRATVISRL